MLAGRPGGGSEVLRPGLLIIHVLSPVPKDGLRSRTICLARGLATSD